jgi:pimeloyl-ACP methyl ester carboxylesterase
MPGYGTSSMDARHDVGLDVQGEAFDALLEHWGLERPHIVAHDYGGAVSLRALLLHGSAYASLCLVDVVALRPWGSPYFELVKEHAAVFTQVPAAMHRGALEAYIAGASHRGLSRDELAMLTAPWLDGTGQAAFYRQIAQADERHTAELEPLLSTLTIPCHIVWGRDDTWIPADRALRLQEAIPSSTMRLIPDAGHLIQLDAPVDLAVELHGWLSRVEASAAQP